MKASPHVMKIVGLSATLVVTAFFVGSYIYWSVTYRDNVYPGITVGSLDLGGKSFQEVSDLIAGRIKKYDVAGIRFVHDGHETALTTAISSFDSDLSVPVLDFDQEATMEAIFGKAESRGYWHYLASVFSPKRNKRILAIYNLNRPAIETFLKDSFPELEVTPQNAFFSLDKNSNGKLVKTGERPGKEIDIDSAVESLREDLDDLSADTITLKTRSVYPTVRAESLSALEPLARTILDRGDLLLRASDSKSTSTDFWRVKNSILITWLSVGEGNREIYLDQTRIINYLKEKIAPAIDREAVLPRYEIKDGRVSSWQAGEKGLALDLEASAREISSAFLKGNNDIVLITKEVEDGAISPDNNFNIKEIIGTGHSAFTGSPANRRHNISVGATSLHGLLIKPGEEFSLIKALGDISDKSGYLPELVIKGDKTVPEFGGGLCQIGTTVFRTALSSGLPITMRQNHSYRVSYYEPAGTDATIYDPQPDFRFVNDTGNYILIQSRLDKNDLYFDFWGVKDGRVASTSDPVIYNIVKPEPTKIVETDTLKPGEKKCTESSHNGADAYFDYTVIYPSDSTSTPVHERRFKSHYIPWQAVCLVGKTATSTPEVSSPTSQATSTNQKAADEAAAVSSN